MIKEGGLLNVHCRIRSCPYPGTNIWSIQEVIASRTSRKRVMRPRDSSSPAEGSGKPAWIVSRTPKKNGQVWCSQSQTVTTISIPREKNSSTIFDRCPDISIPISFITATASGCTPLGSLPALAASKRLLYRALRYPSAIWERTELCTQINRTRGFRREPALRGFSRSG